MQIDDPALTYFCDPDLLVGNTHDERLRRAWNIETELPAAISAIQRVTDGLSCETHLHCCHSVYKRQSDVRGNYRPLLSYFRELRVDRIVAIIVGALMGLAMAYVTVNLHAEQGISGIGFYLFGLGMSDLLFQKLMGTVETVKGFPEIYIPVSSDIPGIGKIFFSQNILVYFAYLLIPIAWFVLNKTNLTGVENPLCG